MEHYFTPHPTSASKPEQILVMIKGRRFTFTTDSGIFSKHELDNGTRLLIETAQIKNGQSVLDLGCGWGAVGVLTGIFYRAHITMSDINDRAVAIAQQNALDQNVKTKSITTDCYNGLELFDTILLNPPQTAGKELCLRMIREGKNHLNPCGSFQLVARGAKGGKTLAAYMKEIYGNVTVIGRGYGFSVWISKRE